MSDEEQLVRLERVASGIVVAWLAETDDLTDTEVRPLLAWALEWAQSLARGVADESSSTGHAGSRLREILMPVRQVMLGISSLAAVRHQLAPRELEEELRRLLALAVRLSQPGSRPRCLEPHAALDGDDRVAWLAREHAGLDNAAFVKAVLGLAATGPHHSESVAQQTPRGGNLDGGTDAGEGEGPAPDEASAGDSKCAGGDRAVHTPGDRGGGL